MWQEEEPEEEGEERREEKRRLAGVKGVCGGAASHSACTERG